MIATDDPGLFQDISRANSSIATAQPLSARVALGMRPSFCKQSTKVISILSNDIVSCFLGKYPFSRKNIEKLPLVEASGKDMRLDS